MRPIVAREAADEQVVLDAALLYVDVLLKYAPPLRDIALELRLVLLRVQLEFLSA